MEDFRNSVAHLDIDVSTAVSVSSVVGENYWKFMYITNTTGTALDTASAPQLITKETYSDIVDSLSFSSDKKALIKKNLASIFEYGSSVQGYLISSAKYSVFKYYAYWCYLEAEYEVDNGTMKFTSDTEALFSAIDSAKDSAFSAFIADLAVDASASDSEAPSAMVGTFVDTLGALTFPLGLFARGATAEMEWTDGSTVSLGYSPALYQLGRTLAYINDTGTPIGNSIDTVACDFQDVLPTRSVSTSILVNPSVAFINWCKTRKIACFKTLGNGTGRLVCNGGWTLKTTALVADWIVAYANFTTKVDCAEIVSVMNTYKNSQTYTKCISAMEDNIKPFIKIGRVFNYKTTAPSWSVAKEMSDRETIIIPGAWTAEYADNVRKVKIQGELTV